MNSSTLNPYQKIKHSGPIRVKALSALSPAINPLFRTLLVLWAVCVASEQFDQLTFYGTSFILTAILGLFCAVMSHKSLVFPWTQMLFLLMVLVAGFRSDQLVHSLVYASKLSIIFLVFAGLQAVKGSGIVLCKALLVNSYVHAITLVLLTFGGVTLLGGANGAHGRTGTILAWPGALWHSAVFGICYYFYLLLSSKNYSIRHAIPLFLFCYVVWRDGSRTGILFLPVVFIFWWMNTKSSRLDLGKIAAFGLILVALIFLSPMLLPNLTESGSVVRLANFFETPGDIFEKLSALDQCRMRMFEKAIGNIISYPILGAGLFETEVRVDNSIQISQDTMSVHNAYLQVWGDMGFFAFISFCGIVFGWIKYVTPGVRSIKEEQGLVESGFIFASLCTVTIFSLSFAVHPFTVVLSDWIYFIAPTVCLAQGPLSAPKDLQTFGNKDEF